MLFIVTRSPKPAQRALPVEFKVVDVFSKGLAVAAAKFSASAAYQKPKAKALSINEIIQA